MPAPKSTLALDKPGLFVPSFTHGASNNAFGSVISLAEVSDTNIDSTSSFRYDVPGAGLRSTQQVNVDWSRFENHTFFNSAEVNVNVAFERIINEYPFDGTRRETEAFFDGMTGFERYVYDGFSKNKGYLFFSGGLGTHIAVDDYAGVSVSALATNQSGKNVLDPGIDPWTTEMHLYVPSEENGFQVVCQKLSGSSQGFTLSLLSSSNATSTTLLFTVASGSSFMNASATLDRGVFNHIVANFDRHVARNRLYIYVNDALAGKSATQQDFGLIDFTTSQLLIGSGSTFATSTLGSVQPTQTLSGALDEFRVWHSTRTENQRTNFARKSVFSTPELRLCFKFNEPSGTLGATSTDKFNRIVLDSSGNSLHSYINQTGFDFSLRSTSSIDNPMTHEKHELSPVLFPNYLGIINWNSELLTTATLYDQQNPNLITKLVPQHYFQEGRAYDGLADADGEIGTAPTNDSIPGSLELGSAQLLSTLLYVYAKFFDEMKIMLDSFSNVLKVGYDGDDTSPDTLLPLIAEFYGFKLPGFFSDASISQFVDAENLDHEISTGTVSLRYVQNQLMRRILTNLREMIASKGTLHSVKTFFRSMGIDPDNSMRIREFGGPSMATLDGLRERKTDTSTLLSMTASAASLVSPYLSGAKIEPPLSFPASTANHTMTDITLERPGGAYITKQVSASLAPSDGLFTSGSWTYEGVYRFPVDLVLTSATQSLARLCVTGSSFALPNVVTNLLAISSSVPASASVRLYARSGVDTDLVDSPLLQLALTGTDLFDGSKWHVSFGRYRADEIGSDVSSSYFLRAEKRDPGSTFVLATTSSYMLETVTATGDVFESVTAAHNASGSFIAIGSQSLASTSSATAGVLLGASDLVNAEARVVAFDGRIGHVRFWSKGLSDTEMSEHARNVRSLGVEDPSANFNFVTSLSGSFGRLRVDASTDQPDADRVASTAGQLRIFDYSQNELHLSGAGFEPSVDPIANESFFIDQLSTVLDEASTSEKVRIRGFSEYANVLNSKVARLSPAYELPKSELPNDDVRFSIDFSTVDALNRDIINMLATLDKFDNVLGAPELVFSPDVPALEALRDVYFNRLTDKVNVRSFQDFFKWIDTSIGLFIMQLLPRKTHFLGMNFVVENHLLERPKLEYHYSDTYIGEPFRLSAGTLLVQQLAGVIRRF